MSTNNVIATVPSNGHQHVPGLTLLEAAEAFPTTDAGNARRLALQQGNDLRHCWQPNQWLVWDGRRWAGDVTGEVMRRAKQTARSIYQETYQETEQTRRQELAQWARRSESCERLEAMIRLARSEPGLCVTPDQLDRDPMLLNCLNGTLDLRSGRLRPHRREDLLTRLVPVEYDERALAPRWQAYLERVLPDPGVRAFVRKAAGYSLSGDVSEQVLFFLYGEGANGKSTLVQVLLGLLAEYGHPGAPDLLTYSKWGRHSTEIADLKGACLVATVETEEGKRLDEVKLKQLTGGDRPNCQSRGQRPLRGLWAVGRGQRPQPPVREELWPEDGGEGVSREAGVHQGEGLGQVWDRAASPTGGRLDCMAELRLPGLPWCDGRGFCPAGQSVWCQARGSMRMCSPGITGRSVIQGPRYGKRIRRVLSYFSGQRTAQVLIGGYEKPVTVPRSSTAPSEHDTWSERWTRVYGPASSAVLS